MADAAAELAGRLVVARPDDSDPVRFWSYVIEAIRVVHPAVGDGALELLRAPRSPALAGALPLLINELADLHEPFALVVDDDHLIVTGAVHGGMVFLLDHAPHKLHLIVLTRSTPPFPISRWRVRGEVTEIRADDLRLDRDDAGSLLNDVLGLDLSDASLAALEERTEGWVAGLYLAALSLQRHPDPESFVAGFAGDDRHVVDYLGSEVLDALPDDVRSLLVRTSILQWLSGPLRDAVLATVGSSELLAVIERTNHFLVPLDTRDEWYRSHQLFRELLRLELERTLSVDVAELHRRAAGWLLKHGYVADAVEHTILAHDRQAAADLIADHWASVLQRGELAVVTGWLDALGDEVVRADPRLCLVRAWMTINVGRVIELGTWIEAPSEQPSSGRVRTRWTSQRPRRCCAMSRNTSVVTRRTPSRLRARHWHSRPTSNHHGARWVVRCSASPSTGPARLNSPARL